MKSFALSVASVALALASFGCTDVGSTHLETAGIQARLTVTAFGTRTTVASAEFQVQDSSTLTYVELQSGDQVTARVEGVSTVLKESKLLGIIDYTAEIDGFDTEGTSYTVALERGDETSAPDSTVTLPRAFSITSPTGSALSYSRADDDIVVTYDNAQQADPMSYSLTGNCIQVIGASLEGDTGTFTIPKGTITLLNPSGAATSCQVTLTVSRTREGSLDSAYAGGSIAGVQARTLQFTTTP